MRSDEVYKIAGGIIVALTIMIGILAFVKMLSISPLWTEQGAAWVQAIGSIAAIAGAYHIGERQASRTRRDRFSAYFAICEAAVNRVELVGEIFCGEPQAIHRRYAEFDLTQLEALQGALRQIPVHELGSPVAVNALLELRDQLKFLANTIVAYDQPVDFHGADKPEHCADVAQTTWAVRRHNIGIHVGAARQRFLILKQIIGGG